MALKKIIPKLEGLRRLDGIPLCETLGSIKNSSTKEKELDELKEEGRS